MGTIDQTPNGSWFEIRRGDDTYSFIVMGQPDTIQLEMARTNTFYEIAELDFLRHFLPSSGSRILDVGANIGNHAVYFDKVCHASYIGVVEPDQSIASELTQNVGHNGCSSVDLRFVGVAAGAGDSWASLLLRSQDRDINNRGGTRVSFDPDGSIPVRRLDELFMPPVDLIKIDVEGMAIDVLEGASGLFRGAHKPVVFVEIETSQSAEFLRWCTNAGYRSRATFQMYPDLINYVLVSENS